MPNGQVPCLELEDGRKMGQTPAIMRYLARIFGYIPESPEKGFEIDVLCEDYCNIIDSIYLPTFE